MEKKPYRQWLLMVLLFFTLAGIGGGMGFAYVYHSQTESIFPGIEIANVPLGGVEQSAAQEMLNEKISPPQTLSLYWEEKEKEYSYALTPSAGHFDLQETVRKASSLSDLLQADYDFFNLVRVLPHRLSFEVSFEASSTYLQRIMEELAGEINREPRNAKLHIEEGRPLVEEATYGRKLDIEQSIATAQNHMARGTFEAIPLQVDEIEPQKKKEDIPDFTHELGSYETPLGGSDQSRRHNIKLAVEALSGEVIEVGEAFSFNKTVGPATAERGYREAPVIRNRRYTMGVGGGICQVATTLYQAALRSEMEVLQRSPHSRPVAYVPLGFDAAVSYDVLDLKFKNSRSFPVLIIGQVEDGAAITFFGEEPVPGRRVEIISEKVAVLSPRVLEQQNPNLPKGEKQVVQEGKEGYRAEVYRLIMENDSEKERELISTDVYQPISTIIQVGVGRVPPDEK